MHQQGDYVRGDYVPLRFAHLVDFYIWYSDGSEGTPLNHLIPIATREFSLEVAPTTLAQRNLTTKDTSRRNVQSYHTSPRHLVTGLK